MEDFHKRFPSFEKSYAQDEDIRKNKELVIENNVRSELFRKAYPFALFSNLINTDIPKKGEKQTIINDGCTHYVDRITGIKYRWSFIKNKWL